MSERIRAVHHEECRCRWDAVFTRNMPFGNPFRPAFTLAGILIETETACRLDSEQYELAHAIAAICGDAPFYLSVTEADDVWSPTGQHWQCEWPPYREYDALPFAALENSIYSPSGKWGVQCSHEEFAVVGVLPEYLSDVDAAWPGRHATIVDLAAKWAEHDDREWIDEIRHAHR